MKSIHLLVSSIVIVLFAFVVVVGPPNRASAPQPNYQYTSKGNLYKDLTISKEFCEHSGGVIKIGDTCKEGEMNVGKIKGSSASEVCCQNSTKKLLGTIKLCDYEAGEMICGKCFCLESGDESCQVIDTSIVGDLDRYIDKEVAYEVASDIDLSKECLRDIRLMSIDYLEPF